jgi:16S rRNA (cytidine1402-2'-O)-methyltransferase
VSDASSPAAGASPAPAAILGLLSVVATPLGNLEDITARALRVLRTCDLIAAEDTRVTRKLLAHFDIHTPLTAYHAHASAGKTDDLLARLRAGKHVALVSDAGTPAISDPGAELVAAACAAGVRVEPVPGPSAVIAVLVASGLAPARFVFEGFLPRTKNDRAERIAGIVRETRTVVLYEAPTRLVDTLTDLAAAVANAGMPSRRVCVAREITKKFEEFRRGTLDEVAAHFRAHPPRGECTVVLEGAPEGAGGGPGSPAAGPDADALLRDALARGVSPRDAAREVARVTGLARRDLYGRVLRLAEGAEPPPP